MTHTILQPDEFIVKIPNAAAAALGEQDLKIQIKNPHDTGYDAVALQLLKAILEKITTPPQIP